MNQIPGMTYMGQVSHPEINGGQPVPCFTPVESANSINTLEGWNALAGRQNRKSFISDHGREPESDDELKTWVQKVTTV